jgi:hypothetical protein
MKLLITLFIAKDSNNIEGIVIKVKKVKIIKVICMAQGEPTVALF